eukprot:CAMPEP_0172205030 /NCGR_PEP_ID=MMETSP1050-20130122/32347_1 /TAXON_ID=233186 /ORGANISM="Cryptomonas curvata, Strain CCAP979/52" /LENGTH=96 /DNA_ID=CAMNT_0012883779 /DNA_START=2088 /DNA_END=2381 /DNA_ORIENTATION=+
MLLAVNNTVTTVELLAFENTGTRLPVVDLKLKTVPAARDEKLKGRQANGTCGVAYMPAGQSGLHWQSREADVHGPGSPVITDPRTQPSGTSSCPVA